MSIRSYRHLDWKQIIDKHYSKETIDKAGGYYLVLHTYVLIDHFARNLFDREELAELRRAYVVEKP